MEWVAAGIALVAAVFTGWQAWEARQSRKQAARAEQRAVQAEVGAGEQAQRSLLQAERSVAAQESIGDAIRGLNKRPEPWNVRQPAPGILTLWNEGGRRVHSRMVRVVTAGGGLAQASGQDWMIDQPLDWPDGSRQLIRVRIDDARLSAPSGLTLQVFWREIDDEADRHDREWTYPVTRQLQ